MSTLTFKRHYGGSLATFEGLLNRFEAYGPTPSCAIRKLADQNFGPDTSTYKVLNWYAHKVAFNNHIFIPGAVLGEMTTIANAWYREVVLNS